MSFRLSQRLSPALESVRPDALFVVKRAIKITPENFIVFDGVRTLERHAQKRKTPCERVTQTLTSNHQTPRRLWRAVHLSPYPIDDEGPVKFPTQQPLTRPQRLRRSSWGSRSKRGGDRKGFIDPPYYEANAVSIRDLLFSGSRWQLSSPVSYWILKTD